MKPFLIALALLTFSLTGGHAASGLSARAATELVFPAMSIHHNVAASAPASEAQFAQLDTNSPAPVLSRLLLTLIVISVVALRLMGLNRARAMADHERSSYHGKAQMFRSLHEERSDRR